MADKVIEAFQVLDDDSSESTVPIKYLKEILLSVGDKMTKEDMDIFMKEIEINEDDTFDYVKFVNNVIQQL